MNSREYKGPRPCPGAIKEGFRILSFVYGWCCWEYLKGGKNIGFMWRHSYDKWEGRPDDGRPYLNFNSPHLVERYLLAE